jgi:hypothetical protein
MEHTNSQSTITSSLCVALVLAVAFAPQWSRCDDTSFCGNTEYDDIHNGTRRTKIQGRTNVSQEVLEQFRKKFPHAAFINRASVDSRQRLERLEADPFPVRLRILYDDTFDAEFETFDQLQFFVRNLIHAVQLMYNQPEMSKVIKLYFVVTKLEKAKRSYPTNMQAEAMLTQFENYNGPSHSAEYDISFLLFAKNIFSEGTGPKPGNLLGMANVGTFCNRKVGATRALLLRSAFITSGIIMAHEFAHSLDVQHDGTGNSIESQCRTENHIMAAAAGEGKNTWSSCSVEAIRQFLAIPDVFQCAYDKKRFETKAINDQFDFSPSSLAKQQEPGQQIPADRQCQLSFDKLVKSVKPNPGHDSCLGLYCLVENDMAQAGPALPGTECTTSSVKQGRCLNGRCQEK